MFVEEVIGAGEIAGVGERSTEPDARELAKLVGDAFGGGHLARKCGLTHFHIGPGRKWLALLRRLLDEFEVKASGSTRPTSSGPRRSWTRPSTSPAAGRPWTSMWAARARDGRRPRGRRAPRVRAVRPPPSVLRHQGSRRPRGDPGRAGARHL
jgi:hypothetical protein